MRQGVKNSLLRTNTTRQSECDRTANTIGGEIKDWVLGVEVSILRKQEFVVQNKKVAKLGTRNRWRSTKTTNHSTEG